MVDFLWYHGYGYTVIDGSEENVINIDLLKTYIEKYGINTRDSNGHDILSYLCLFTISDDEFKRVVDFIFEYHPIVFRNNHIYEYQTHLIMKDHYVTKKTLSQDVNYVYLNYSFNYMDRYFINIESMIRYFRNRVDGRYHLERIQLFKDHFNKGITFFELMKYRLLDNK